MVKPAGGVDDATPSLITRIGKSTASRRVVGGTALARMWRGGSMALHVYMRACTHVGMYTCGHVVHMQACTHACTHVCMYMSTHTHRIPVTIPSQGCVKEAVRSMQTCPDFRVIYKSHELPTQTAVGIRRVTPPFGGEEVEGRRWRGGGGGRVQQLSSLTTRAGSVPICVAASTPERALLPVFKGRWPLTVFQAFLVPSLPARYF